ncbi:MAG TPA: PilC/PilY family type IV pilus protein [Burkholderiales bacterium]|nr:PilC/PilY family type IV pilus protein [Burkholderiales bacterium]
MRNLARYLSIGALALSAWSGAQAQTAFSLAAQPLNVANNIAPNVVFALSVEFPTAITPAYNYSASVTTTSGPYVASNTYLGYFDPGKCYDYTVGTTITNAGSTGAATTTYSATTAATRYFVPVAFVSTANSNHDCSGAHWAGNFLNYVAMAGLDEFRFAMTGGTRIVDTTSLTVLQRTFQTSQGSNFAEKTLTGNTLIAQATPLTASGSYFFNSTGLNVQMEYGTTSGTSHATNSFYVQAQVCKPLIGTVSALESNCTAYTDSSGTVTYKPTGAVQNNSDSMRFSVLSYFNSDNIDNAVLRAKMKFTGQYTYDASGVQSANAQKEWSPTTGIYVLNPATGDANVTLLSTVVPSDSGVVNYVNKFGLSGSYKKYDNVGKLYYEALAYLRHRTLDSAFYSAATTANADNFPVISAYTEDPIQAYCQKNFIFVMGDTHTHCDKRLPGGAYSAPGPDQCKVGTTTNTANTVADSGSLSNGDTLNVDTLTGLISSSLDAPADGGSSGAASFYMAGLAFWAHTNDIRTDLNTGSTNKTTVTTYIVDVQETQDQGFDSQYWYAAKYGGFDTSAGASAPNASTVPGTSNWAVYDAGYDGPCTKRSATACTGTSNASNDGNTGAGHGVRPKTYLPAGNPTAMINAVNSAFAAISAATKGDAAVTSSTGNLNVTGSVYQYQSTFTSVTWVGDLLASLVSTVTSGVSVSSTVAWQASTKLNAGTPSSTARVVLSYNDGMASYTSNTTESLTNSRKGIGFSSTSTGTTDLSTAQQGALDINIGGVNDSLHMKRINYIRGSRADEPSGTGCTGGGGGGAAFRCRSTSLLGDIVHSQPAVVGAPTDMDFNTSDPSPTDVLFQPGYITFAINKASRAPAVYVGANDGMLHGFNSDQSDSANLGKEIMAYVPSPVVKNLSRLTSSSYAHTYYVDASPRVASACPATAGCVDDTSWKTVLVSGLGAGGQGVFALDVTSPSYTQPSSGASSSTVLWEFTDRTDPDVGYILGKPVIAKMNNGKWAAIFGNGLNNTTADGAPSTTGAAALYIVFLSGPTGTSPARSWVAGTDYIKLVAGTGATSPATATPGTTAIPNGLNTPVGIDKDLDGAIDYIYAGDAYGNVWKFDVTSSSVGSWVTGFSGAPMFSARDGSGNVQPITEALGVSFSLYGGFMVNFGTGRYLATADANSTTQQTLYGVLDHLDGTKPPTTAIGTAPSFRTAATTNSLQQQTIVAAGWFTGSAAAGTVSAFTVNTAHNSCEGVPTNATCVQAQSDCLVNFPGLNLPTTLHTTTTQCTTAVTSPPVQLGWYFDFANSAEREVEDRPLIQSGIASFTSLTPSGVACSGGLQGYAYSVDANTGGAPPQNVFDVTGSGLSNAAQQLVVGGIHFVITSVALPAGSTVNTPARYTLPQNSASGTPGVGGGAGGASVGCASGTFVAGWGCVGVSSGGVQHAAQCSGNTFCQGLFLPGQKNRLYWRQLFTQ